MTPAVEAMRNHSTFTVLDRAVCLTLRCKAFGNNRKTDIKKLIKESTGHEAKEDDGSVTVDDKTFRAIMHLLDPEDLQDVRRPAGKAKALLRAKGISAARVFGERTYLIPDPNIEVVEAGLIALADETEYEAGRLADRFEEAVEKQKVKLGPMFDPKKYPTANEIRHAFRLSWQYVSFKSPEKLETISSALARRSHQQYESDLAAMFDETIRVLRSEALEIVSDLENKLQPDKNGHKKALHPSALNDIQTFIANLPTRNLGDDGAIVEAMERVTQLAEGIDVEAVKSSDALREQLRNVASATKEALETLVDDAPERRIAFGVIRG